mmetsp:Transcript_113017/g.243477  ORF Transcript_113017/g.243477 Transcript_113017/m.243477 type:complete len:92 (+) Transcript_113017:543-818(+)
MEFCEGNELYYLMGRLSEEHIKSIALQLTLAILHLHERQIVFRDLKPENVIYGSGQARLIDFGLSRICAPHDNLFNFAGTLQYFAPEVIKG